MGTYVDLIPLAEVEALLRCAAEQFGVPVRIIRSRSRTTEPMDARRACMLALSQRGWSCTAIAQALGRDHSTVLHNIRRGESMPACLAAAAALNGDRLPGVAGCRLGHYGASVADAVLSYLGLLLGQPANEARALTGLRLIARNPQLAAAAYQLLCDRNRGHHFWRIAIHAKQLGLPVDNLSTGLSTGSA